MAVVGKEVIKTYKLELNEAEYHAFEIFMAESSYGKYKDLIIRSKDYKYLKTLTVEEFSELYEKLRDNR